MHVFTKYSLVERDVVGDELCQTVQRHEIIREAVPSSSKGTTRYIWGASVSSKYQNALVDEMHRVPHLNLQRVPVRDYESSVLRRGYCYNTASKALKSNLNLLMHIVGLVLLKELAYQPHCAGCTCQSCADYKSDAGENGCVRKGATLGVDEN